MEAQETKGARYNYYYYYGRNAFRSFPCSLTTSASHFAMTIPVSTSRKAPLVGKISI